MVILRYTYNVLCFVVRTFALHYGLLAFEMKGFSKSVAVYASVYFIGHIAVVMVYILDLIVPRQKESTKES